MTYKVDQFAAIHPRVEGEIYVDWDKVRMLALKGEISTSQHDILTGQLAQALLEKGRRIEDLEGALDFYACVDHYQIHNAAAPNVVQFDRGAKARAALKGGSDE